MEYLFDRIRLLTLVGILLMATTGVFSQFPEKMSYQAIVRNSSGQLVKNSDVAMRISILSGSASGPVVYAETHKAATNENGLLTLAIGNGIVVSGNLSAIDWSQSSYFLKTETDASGGNNFSIIGVSQLLSVPYALHAKTVEIDKVNDADADPLNEIQTISKIGNVVSFSNQGGSFIDAVDDADADPANEIQTIAKTGNIVSLSKNGGSFTDAVDDADADPVNEIQTIVKTGNTVSLSNNGGSFTDAVDDADADPLNEIQVLTKTGNTIVLSKNGGSITDNDSDASNEIQVLSLNGNNLTLSKDGGTVTLPTQAGGTTGDNWGTQTVVPDATLSGNGTPAAPLKIAPQSANAGQVLKWNGANWSPAADETGTGDLWGSQVVATNASLEGNGTIAIPLKLAQQSAKTGQVLKWNGNDWVPGNDNDVDGDTINELQTISLTGNNLTLSKNGGTITLPNSGGSGDNWGTQTVVSDVTLSGTGTTGNPLKLSQQSATNGQVLLWNGTAWIPGNAGQGGCSLSPGDSLVLKDSQGVTRMVLNPNTGTFKMMNHDTVWYSISVNSPPENLTRNDDGSVTEEIGEGHSRTYIGEGENRQMISEEKTSISDDGKINSEVTNFTNNQMTEKITTTGIFAGIGTYTKTVKECFNSDGKKISEQTDEVGEVLGGVFGGSIQKTTHKSFDLNGNVTSEVVLDNGKVISNKVTTPGGSFTSTTSSNGFSFQGGGANKLEVTPTQNGSSYSLGLNDGTNSPPIINFNSDPVYGGWFDFTGSSLGFNVHETFTQGNVVVGGTLNVNGTKNFRIDHPDDPENKYLQHASVESDEVLNQYSGNVITGADGFATVILPDYVAKINTDFRYQLTVIGEFARAIVYKKFENNQFVIQTDQPDVEVSWQLTARRNDQYMREHPFEAVVKKEASASRFGTGK